VPGDWAKASATKPDAGRKLRGSDFYGSSDDFREYLRVERPDLLAPERDVVPLCGEIEWDPSHETPSEPRCPACWRHYVPVSTRPAPLVLHRILPIPDRDDNGRPMEHVVWPVGCPKCLGRILAGSRLYCPKCHASGYDFVLSQQRRMVGTPPKGSR
jgi:hypothetical protein